MQESRIDFDPTPFFPESRFGAVKDSAPILLGMSGALVYSVSTEMGDFILRLDRAGVDRSGTNSAQTKAAEQSIAPKIIRADGNATISAKIPGISFAQAIGNPASRGAVMESLVEQLAKLHALDPHGLPKTDMSAIASEIWTIQCARPGFPIWAIPLGDRLNIAASELTRDDRLVFSHCDLNPGNMLWDGQKLWFVDWEQCKLAHPYLDLAIVGIFLSLADDDVLGLLAAQERTVINPAERLIFMAVRDLARLIYGCIFLQLVPDLTRIKFDSLDQTPSLKDCFSRLSVGQLDMKSPEARGLIGAAFFKQFLQN